ncbi:MAG: hypothetical protein WBQ73_02990 [Candidatus Babeliales bacterium]
MVTPLSSNALNLVPSWATISTTLHSYSTQAVQNGKTWYNTLPPEQQRYCKIGTIALGIITVGSTARFIQNKRDKKRQERKEKWDSSPLEIQSSYYLTSPSPLDNLNNVSPDTLLLKDTSYSCDLFRSCNNLSNFIYLLSKFTVLGKQDERLALLFHEEIKRVKHDEIPSLLEKINTYITSQQLSSIDYIIALLSGNIAFLYSALKGPTQKIDCQPDVNTIQTFNQETLTPTQLALSEMFKPQSTPLLTNSDEIKQLLASMQKDAETIHHDDNDDKDGENCAPDIDQDCANDNFSSRASSLSPLSSAPQSNIVPATSKKVWSHDDLETHQSSKQLPKKVIVNYEKTVEELNQGSLSPSPSYKKITITNDSKIPTINSSQPHNKSLQRSTSAEPVDTNKLKKRVPPHITSFTLDN